MLSYFYFHICIFRYCFILHFYMFSSPLTMASPKPHAWRILAQELTEASIHESDAMVDQLERAEVAEEKRAVFRALTRLRGAAITSFDGVARSQTGNIDEYNKVIPVWHE